MARMPAPMRAYSPSVIIAAILAFVFLASASIHLFLRFISHSSGNSPLPSSLSSSSSSMPLLIHHRRSSSTTADSSVLSDEEKAVLIESLPLFSLASSIAVFPRSSLDCAVYLSPFQPHNELRLLPICRHTFHSPCIDTWLRSTSLYRSFITLPGPPHLRRWILLQIQIQQLPHRHRQRQPPEDARGGGHRRSCHPSSWLRLCLRSSSLARLIMPVMGAQLSPK